MLGQPRKLGIRAGASQDLSVARSNHAPALALERQGDDGRPAAPSAGVDDFIHEVHKLLRKSHGDLLTHTITVANWYQNQRSQPLRQQPNPVHDFPPGLHPDPGFHFRELFFEPFGAL
jgi:hypothetical protein